MAILRWTLFDIPLSTEERECLFEKVHKVGFSVVKKGLHFCSVEFQMECRHNLVFFPHSCLYSVVHTGALTIFKHFNQRKKYLDRHLNYYSKGL